MDKTIYLSMPKDVIHGRGYVYSLQYHIVWVTKYRKPIFLGGIESDVKEYLLETLKSLDMIPIAMEIMPDHIHLLVDCKPQLRLSDAIKRQHGTVAVHGSSGDKEAALGRSLMESIIFCGYRK